MAELWLATGNDKKRAELERLLLPLGVQLRTPRELPVPFAPEESAPDFAGNARLKARALARLVAGVALADDSGLCVDALDGRPGVHSARYGGPGLDDRGRLQRLLDELRAVPDGVRTAHFVCSLCLCAADGSVRAEIEARCSGVLLPAARGVAGFGYDPIFVADESLSQPGPPTFAELDAATKDKISHRGKALARLLQLLRRDPGLLRR